MKKIVLDSSAIINGINLVVPEITYITAPAVVDEIKLLHERKKIELAIDLNKIEERLPKAEFLEKVYAAAEETADTISEEDIQLIALALEFSAEIATDDYGIQNIATKLGLGIIPVLERGIKKVLHWQYYCPGCKRKYEGAQEVRGSGAQITAARVCEVCGNKLKRKAKK